MCLFSLFLVRFRNHARHKEELPRLLAMSAYSVVRCPLTCVGFMMMEQSQLLVAQVGPRHKPTGYVK